MRITNRTILKISLGLNLIFIMGFMVLVFTYKYKIYDKIASYKTYNIVMLGNSLSSRGQWNMLLNRTDIKNSGVGGVTSSHFVVKLKTTVLKYRPKICFIEGGINDISMGIPLSRTYLNYTTIVDTLLKYRVEPILQSTLFVNNSYDSIPNSKVDTLNSFLKNLAIKKGIEYLDLNQYFSTNKRLKMEYSIDGVHLNQRAYKIWTDEIRIILKRKGI